MIVFDLAAAALVEFIAALAFGMWKESFAAGAFVFFTLVALGKKK